MVITPQELHELLEYRDGTLYWRKRDTPQWDKVNAGNPVRSKTGPYLYFSISGKRYAVHRAVWAMLKGAWPSSQIDHINRDPLDNRIENLREATPLQNSGNTGIWKTNSSGYRGVSFHKATGKWRAYTSKGNVHKSLGYYLSPEAAAIAYNKAALEYFGEFATLNNL